LPRPASRKAPSPTDAIHPVTERPLCALGEGYFILPFEYCLAAAELA
jgi:hypothetical protein